ncbi:ABC transporter ATP-binding protein [Calorimonas adulescens]|jgi:oligopeptide/dipeptide ABC transporter, ATP-binding protein, C-terminal domain|uniref:ABC transporter ATP-binding protein n=1 Tax=Calorimonas adulescens TaxID=2606906 RepID=A0A5D8QD25_9THEO|nr:ABC transporter ATP-binding protein [Calorimonas adulescens]TZE81706.1 ABC transporter ATP-binding protein [Calorimonas adulescens]
MPETILEVQGLKKYFFSRKGLFGGRPSVLKAVDNVSFKIERGKTMGLVGESGCGKTTAGRTIIKLYEPTGGHIIYKGEDITGYDSKKMLPLRRSMQIIFQDPYASLDSRMTVADIIGEPLDIHHLASGKDREDRIKELLRLVGLNDDHASRYPHEFSGGQRQRIGIARSLAVEPEFIVCDEPISALDVSIQAQIVNMLEDLQDRMGLTYLFIAHDLSMVRHISDDVGVMYLGQLVETAPSEELYQHPLHPYTQALLSAIPIPDPQIAKSRQRILLEGDVPSPIDPPPGCRFKGRCPYAMDICSEKDPELVDVGGGHYVACYLIKK